MTASTTPGRPAIEGLGVGWRGGIAILALAAASIAGAFWLPPIAVGGVLAFVSLCIVFRQAIFSWKGALFGMTAVLLFVPIRQIKLAIPLPFALEPYRLIIVLVLLAIVVSLLVNPSARWRPGTFGWSIAAMLAGLLASIGVNAVSLTEGGFGNDAVGSLAGYLLIVSVFFVTRQLLDGPRTVERLLQFLVIGGTIVSLGAIFERLTRVNVFLQLASIPGLQAMRDDTVTIVRSGGARAFGSAQHPIALAVMLAMLMSIAVYLSVHSEWPRRSSRRSVWWLGCVVVMAMGVVCTVSRTSFIMLPVMALLAVLLRPSMLTRLLFVGIPLAGIASLVAPNAVQSMLYSFTQPGKLISSQYAAAGWRGSGRLADVGPALTDAAKHPFFGTGIGSRVVIGPKTNAFILDDQILTTLREAGAVGVLGVACAIVIPTVCLLLFARRRRPLGILEDPLRKQRDLAAAIGIASGGYFVAMFFFDAFSFFQAVMILFMLLAVGSWVLTSSRASLSDAMSLRREVALSR